MPEFSVEVPGEASPLTEAALEHTLRAAASRDTNQIQTGTKQLQNWSTQKGFYPLLQNAFLCRTSLPLEIRMLAIIQLKNGIDKHWRRAAINGVSARERDEIRSKLLQGTLEEPNDRLADLSSIVTAKIARYEYPAQCKFENLWLWDVLAARRIRCEKWSNEAVLHWKDLMKELIAILQESAGLNVPPNRLLRALHLTHHVVKELSTIRMTVQRAAFQVAAPGLLATLQQIYFFRVQQWQSSISNQLNQQTLQSMNITERTLKAIRRLVVNGFTFPHRDDGIKDFWTGTSDHVRHYMQMHQQENLQNAYRISAIAHAKQLAKTHVGMAREHGTSFALLPAAPYLVRFYWITAKDFRRQQLSSTDDTDDDQVQVYNSFNLRAILILRACFKEAFTPGASFRYRNEQGKHEPVEAKEILHKQLLTEEFVNELFQTVISNFFLYIQSDIEEWITEPEEWDIKEEGDEDAYDKSLRAAAERLFLDITLHYKDLVISPLLQTVLEVASSPNAQPLLKDAMYSALGVAGPILNGRFDFDTFLKTNLVTDLQIRDPAYTVVRRRISILIARWITINISDENRPLVYKIFATMLDSQDPINNLSIRITAAKRLKDVVNEMSFNAEAFQPNVPVIVARLLDLIREVNLAETKLAILETVAMIVKRMSQAVVPFAEEIVSILQKLWDESGSENLMKVAIVTILRRLLESMGGASSKLHSTALATIVATVTPESELQIYLLEAALDLWIVVLEGASSPASDALLSMIQYIAPFLRDEDHTQRAVKITRSYVLLAPERMLSDEARSVFFPIFSNLLDVKQSSVVDSTSAVVELMIRAAESLGGEQAAQVVAQSLITSGLAPRIFNSLGQNWLHHDGIGVKKPEPPRDWKNETNYLLISSRVIMSSVTSFLYMAHQYAESAMLTNTVVCERFLEESFRHMDSVFLASEKKIICMALTKLLETGQPWILEKLQDMMSLWTTMVKELEDDEKGGDCLVYNAPFTTVETANPESERSTVVMYSDPVHSINLSHFIKYHLQSAVQRVGGEQRFQQEWLVNVDKEVVKAFGDLGIM